MNTDEVSSLKREWNLIMEEGRPMLDRLKFLGRRALEIQTIMIDEDPDLAFSMMFGYDIEEE